MAADPDCPHCEGFGHVPEGETPGWYGRDWRLLIDPAVRWAPCRACHRSGPYDDLHRVLARALLERIDRDAGGWRRRGGWQEGDLSGQVVWRWHHLACLPPGPLAGLEWILASDHGVCHEAERRLAALHCQRAGAPPLPAT